MDTLISFLGKPNNGYKETRYQLNGQEFVTKFMGADLAKLIKPQKLLLIGTAGSMWDVKSVVSLLNTREIMLSRLLYYVALPMN